MGEEADRVPRAFHMFALFPKLQLMAHLETGRCIRLLMRRREEPAYPEALLHPSRRTEKASDRITPKKATIIAPVNTAPTRKEKSRINDDNDDNGEQGRVKIDSGCREPMVFYE